MEDVPEHIAIIMDGNGRWAKSRFLNKAAGHRAGAQALRRLAVDAEKMGVKILTVYAFSTENWKRPQDEVDTLMELIHDYIQQYIDDSKKNDMRICLIGDLTRLSDELQRKIADLQEMTSNKKGLRIVIALNYGGRDDITRAARKLAADVRGGRTTLNEIDEKMFASYLDTKDLPDPDLLIRTSGEMRISNFLLWQTAYSEMYFCDKLWPDFTIKDLEKAISQYRRRDRRYGGRNE
ncbi:MAG: isoprenyl transferase [Clostridiales bacterium]|jgi:undecaprenyl diphosphate synthase|nr:isoprenyl transferase [Clostridiales bacterium]